MITVMGLGFIGVTVALGFAHFGRKVYGWDVNKARVKSLRAGKVPFYEPHLEEALHETMGRTLLFPDSLEECLQQSEVVFYCVGTPNREDGSVDLAPLKGAIDQTLKALPRGRFTRLVIRSTVPPPTTQEIIAPFIEERGFHIGKEIGLANNPEFLREGCAWENFTHPDRIIIGQMDEDTGKYLVELYAPFHAPVWRVSPNTAEFIKYLTNSFLATLISYSNQMRMFADEVGGIDVPAAFRLLHSDQRWFGSPANMSSYVFPGCGFGGYCLPKDCRALCAAGRGRGRPLTIVQEALSTNDQIKKYVVERIKAVARPDERIGILGLSFKPGSDDVRETVAADIIRLLLQEGFRTLTAYDPLATKVFKETYGLEIQYAASLEEAVRTATLVVIVTAWPQFVEKRALFAGKKVLDFRYVL
jgi:UDPglucose 6-dehydrogenase